MKKLIVMGLVILMTSGCALYQAQLDAKGKAAGAGVVAKKR